MRSISLTGAWREDLGALRHATAESIKLNEILHRIHVMVELYGWPCFSAMRLASLLKATVADGPHPPLEDKTKGVKVPCSTSRMRCS